MTPGLRVVGNLLRSFRTVESIVCQYYLTLKMCLYYRIFPGILTHFGQLQVLQLNMGARKILRYNLYFSRNDGKLKKTTAIFFYVRLISIKPVFVRMEGFCSNIKWIEQVS